MQFHFLAKKIVYSVKKSAFVRIRFHAQTLTFFCYRYKFSLNLFCFVVDVNFFFVSRKPKIPNFKSFKPQIATVNFSGLPKWIFSLTYFCFLSSFLLKKLRFRKTNDFSFLFSFKNNFVPNNLKNWFPFYSATCLFFKFT